MELRQLTGNQALTAAEVDSGIARASSDYNYFMRLYLTGKLPSLSHALRLTALHRGVVLADAGRMTVLGYLKTKQFFVWLGKGDDAVAELDYTLTGPVSTFAFRRVSSKSGVGGRLTVPNRSGHRWRAEIAGKVVTESSGPEIVVSFDLNDTVVLRRVD